MKLVSVSDVKAFLEKTDSVHDTLLGTLVEQVSKAIESATSRTLTQTEYTEYFNGGKRYYYVKAYPIFNWKSIVSITLSGTSAVSVNIATHGFITGNKVKFKDILGTTELNDNTYNITKTDSSNFTLDGTNSSNFTAFISGGYGSKAPVVTVSDSTGYEDKSDYYIWDTEGLIEFVVPPSTSLPRQVKVVYTGGYAESGGVLQVPDDLKRACLMQSAFEFKRRKDLGISSLSMPDGSIAMTSSAALLPEVVRIIKLYRNYNVDY